MIIVEAPLTRNRPVSPDYAQSHARAIARLRTLSDVIRPDEVAAAFVASLGSRRLEHRSALGSYALARVIPDHPLDADPEAHACICRVCGWARMPPGEEEPDDRLRYERAKWGGVRHQDPVYAELDLALFRETEPPLPQPDDWRALELILRTPSLLLPTAKPADLEHALKGVFPSNKNERRILIRILACAGVFEARGHPGFFDGFIPGPARELPPYHYLDWGYPTIWWRASDGVRRDAAGFWFPQIADRLPA